LALLALAGCSGKTEGPAAVTADTKGSFSERASPSPPSPAAPAATVSPTLLPATSRLQALGTEPFWSIETGDGKMRYSSPEELKGIAVDAVEETVGGAQRFSGQLQGKPVVLLVESGNCSDGMSDTVYPYKAGFTWGGKTELGCARSR
jgi:uncharacterized membrane protein